MKDGFYTGHYYPSPDYQPGIGQSPDWAKTNLSDLLGSLKKYEPETVRIEGEKSLQIKMVVPESSRSNFVVEVKTGRIFVSHKVEKETVITKNFKASVVFEGDFNTNSATAKYKDGVLTVEIPKEKPNKISVE